MSTTQMAGHQPTDDEDDLTPSEAAEEFLTMRALDLADSTLASYKRRLRSFLLWCEDAGVRRLSELTPRNLRHYSLYERQQGNAPSTVKNRMTTVTQLVRFYEGDLLPDGLSDHVDVPTVSKEDQTDDTKLDAEQARALLKHLDEHYYGSRQHALLTILWHVGCRRGSVRALDKDDFHYDPDGESYLEFRHRKDIGLPLKNGPDGERAVSLAQWAADVIQAYITTHRHDIRDEHGLEPLITSIKGRPTVTGLSQWVYDTTLPCIYGPCPHDKDPETCEWAEHNQTTKCPSSRSPHQIRTGVITDMCNRGIPVEAVAKRVDAKPATIRRFYDKATQREEMDRRKHYFTGEDKP